MVTRPWKSGERHSGYIANTSLLKTLERDVFVLDIFFICPGGAYFEGHIRRPLRYIYFLYFFFQSGYYRMKCC